MEKGRVETEWAAEGERVREVNFKATVDRERGEKWTRLILWAVLFFHPTKKYLAIQHVLYPFYVTFCDIHCTVSKERLVTPPSLSDTLWSGEDNKARRDWVGCTVTYLLEQKIGALDASRVLVHLRRWKAIFRTHCRRRATANLESHAEESETKGEKVEWNQTAKIGMKRKQSARR